jgi:inner membrane protein
VLAANAPDIDVFSYVRGEYFALSFRRGITHGWPALLILSFVVTALMLVYDRAIRRRRDTEAEPARAGSLLALSMMGVLTHPALDWMNTYGMRWGLPFGDAWTYGDALFIIDPWIWLVLGGAVFFVSSKSIGGLAAWALLFALASLVVLTFSFGTGAKAIWFGGLVTIAVLRFLRGTSPAHRRLPTTALAIVAVYISTMVGADLMARRQVRSSAESIGLRVQDVMVAPAPANPFRAEIEVMTDTGFVPGVHRWFGSSRIELHPERIVPLLAGPVGVPVTELAHIVTLARREPEVAGYLAWSRYPYVRIEPDGTGWWVQFSDARYDTRSGTGGLSGLRVRIRD